MENKELDLNNEPTKDESEIEVTPTTEGALESNDLNEEQTEVNTTEIIPSEENTE